MSHDLYKKQFGNSGENLVREYYENLDWKLLHQNKTEKGSEIDLIMEKFVADKDTHKKRVVLFIEVKTVDVTNRQKILPEDNFTKPKQKHLKRGVELYLTKNKLHSVGVKDLQIRIDLACVYYDNTDKRHSIVTYENIILE